MTLSDIKRKLDTLGIPVTYRAFSDKVKPPYAVYYCVGEEHRGSDFENLIAEKDIIIELYCKKKDLEIEEKIEKLFNFTELEKTESYISETRLILTIYEFSIITKEK